MCPRGWEIVGAKGDLITSGGMNISWGFFAAGFARARLNNFMGTRVSLDNGLELYDCVHPNITVGEYSDSDDTRTSCDVAAHIGKHPRNRPMFI
jgi:hypothetical protein